MVKICPFSGSILSSPRGPLVGGLSLVLAGALAASACGDSAAGTDVTSTSEGTTATSDTSTSTGTTTETSDMSTSAGTTDTGDGQPGMGLPEGESTWTGTISSSGIAFPTELTIVNASGDLTATVTYTDNPDSPIGLGTAVHTLTGTHDPASGRLAFAPNTWVMEPAFEVELLGMSGSFDPDTDTISGVVNDYVSPMSPEFAGGPVELSLVNGPGEPTAIGDGAAALAQASQNYTGTYQCTGSEREIAGEIIYDGSGGVTGNVSIGDPDLGMPLGTFEFSGVHNPTTGGITLVPGSWTAGSHSVLTFFVDATHDPGAGTFHGDGRINIGPCPPGLWRANF